MVFYGKNNTIFEGKPQAWVNGPVYPEVYKLIKVRLPICVTILKLLIFAKVDRKLR